MAVRPDDKAAGGSSHNQQDYEWDKVLDRCAAAVEAVKGAPLTAVERDTMAKRIEEAVRAYKRYSEDQGGQERKSLADAADKIAEMLPLLLSLQNTSALHRIELAERRRHKNESADDDPDDIEVPDKAAHQLRTLIENLSDFQGPLLDAVADLEREPSRKGRKPDHGFLMLVYHMARTWERLLPGHKAGTSLVRGASDRSGPFVRFMEPVVPLLPGYDTVQFGVKVKDALSELSKLND